MSPPVPPQVDYQKLKAFLDSPQGQSMPDALKARMQADIARNLGPSGAPSLASPSNPFPVQPDVTNVASPQAQAQAAATGDPVASAAMAPVRFGFQLAHDMSAGIVPAMPDGTSEWDQKFAPAVKVAAGLGAVMAQGSLVMRAGGFALGWVSKVPVVATVLEAIPERLAEIGVGAFIGGALDAARPDPEQNVQNPSMLDPSSEIGAELNRLGVNPRLAMGLGGAVTGGAISGAIMGIVGGFNSARARMIPKLSEDQISSIKSSLEQAGLPTMQGRDPADVAQTFLQNLRKVTLKQDVSGVVADQLARESYIANEFIQAGPTPRDIQIKAGTPEHDFAGSEWEGKAYPQAEPAPQAIVSQYEMRGPTLGVPKEGEPGIQVLNHSNTGQDGTIGLAEGQKAIAKYGPDGKLMGMLSFRVDPLSNVIHDENYGGGLQVWVSPVFRRQGIATELYDEAQSQGYDLSRAAGATVTPDGKALTDALKARGVIHPITGTPPNPQFTEQDGRLLSGIFRANPGGVNIVTGIQSADAVEVARQRLGISLNSAVIPQQDGTFHVLVTRPNYEYPDAASVSKVTAKIQGRLAAMAKDASKEIGRAPTTETLLLPNGVPIRGGLNTAELADKLKLQRPIVDGVERPDLALREFGRFVRMDIPTEGHLVLELPSNITQQQFNSIGRAVDVMKFDQVTVRLPDGTEQALTQPFGAQVQDAVAQKLAPKSTTSTLTPQMVSQYARTGVFKGQAVILQDGTTGSIVSKAGVLYKVQDAITGNVVRVHPNRMTILPTTLAGEMQPSNLFTQYLSPTERQALASLRSSIAQGYADEITKYSDFEGFANTRGYIASQLRGGRIQLAKVNEGGAQPLSFQNLKSALEYVRKDNSAVPELTPDKVSQILGPDRNIGLAGGGSPPPRPNELMPIDPVRQQQSLENIAKGGGPNSWNLIVKPTLPLMQRLDEKFGTQMYNAMFNVQQATVARDNFLGRWYHGIGEKLPDGILPLKKIQELAGSGANKEGIFDYLEAQAGTPEKDALAAALKPNELKAANELRKWYNSAYSMFGVDAPFIEDFMPHYREVLQTQGSMGLAQAWQVLGNDIGALPKGADWISDHVREGLLDVYSKDPFQVAQQYLRGYAKNRFMSQPLDEARKMVYELASKNRNVALPMAQALQAMSGFEFQEQRAALSQAFGDLISKIPGGGLPHENKQIGDRMVDYLTSAVYKATMGFRPSLALRNAFQAVIMAYPVYGGDRFWEGVGRALTAEGKEEAMAARALSASPQGMLRQEPDLFGKLTGPLEKLNEASTVLYDDADQFTRATTYWTAKLQAQDALTKFGQEVSKGGLSPERVSALKRQLIQDTKLYLQGPEAVTEFLRRAGTDPEGAAQYAGKVGSDMTNFLYGRGMQPRWMRSVSGRLLGQFGSWSMWYLDYLSRIGRAATSGEYRTDALRILGRHALVNAAIVASGKAMGVDLNKWASYGALFYSGGPGLQVAVGASTLMRGMGDVSTFGESPMGPTRVQEGAQAIWSTLPSFVPYYYVGRDALRLVRSDRPTEVLANLLGTNTTLEDQQMDRIRSLLGDGHPPFQSTSPMQAQMLNNRVMGTGQQPVDIRQYSPGIPSTPGVGPVPNEQSPVGGGSVKVGGSMPVGLTGPGNVPTPAGVVSQIHPGGYTGPVESRPVNF